MDDQSVHELTAAYALDALEPRDARAYEEHLAHCARCREELGSFAEATTALAYAVDAPAPPAELRERILARARAERGENVVPLRPRWALPVATVAAVAACAAVGLGIWAAVLSGRLDREQARVSAQERAAAILGDPAARRVAIPGDRGTLVVAPGGEGALVLRRLAGAGSGKTYEAWVAVGGKPQPAGTFEGGREVVAVPLGRPVPDGAAVMVTRERAGGTDAPTQTPFVVVRAPQS